MPLLKRKFTKSSRHSLVKSLELCIFAYASRVSPEEHPPSSNASSPDRSTSTPMKSTHVSKTGRTKPVLFHFVVFGDDLLQQRDCIRACSRPCGWGSFVQNTFNNPGLSKCGKTVLPFRYVDSPLSGCLGLEGYCDCGWSGFETISGWFKRGVAMREQLTDDKIRHSKYKLFHINAELATLDELSTWLTL